MICQIACRSGFPQSVIAATWSPEELQQAEALARLEGWGQEKRRTAMLAAQIHNAVRLYGYSKTIEPDKPLPPLPTLLTEGDFLPVRVRKKAADPVRKAAQEKKAAQSLSSIMNSLCGF